MTCVVRVQTGDCVTEHDAYVIWFSERVTIRTETGYYKYDPSQVLSIEYRVAKG